MFTTYVTQYKEGIKIFLRKCCVIRFQNLFFSKTVFKCIHRFLLKIKLMSTPASPFLTHYYSDLSCFPHSFFIPVRSAALWTRDSEKLGSAKSSDTFTNLARIQARELFV